MAPISCLDRLTSIATRSVRTLRPLIGICALSLCKVVSAEGLWVGVFRSRGKGGAWGVRGSVSTSARTSTGRSRSTKRGKELLSRRVENEQEDIAVLIDQADALGRELVWGVDMSHGPVVLLVASLLAAGQPVVFVPGLMVNRCRGAFVGRTRPMRSTLA